MGDRFDLMVFPPHVSDSLGARPFKPRKGLYAAPPGTGPAGETCGSCRHICRHPSGRYRKCGVVRALWTHGPGTDIKARSPACAKWEAA